MTTRTDVSSEPAGGSSEYFDVRHLRTDLRGRAVRGGMVTVASQGGRMALQFLTTMVLARLIAPEQFGFFAMATAVTGFVSLFREMGLSTATVQRQEVSHGQISVLFWINATMGLAISLVMFLLARPIAWFYGVPDLASLVRVLSLGPVIGGLAVQHGALLDRQMRFGTKATINVGSVAVGAVVAIALAWWGAGYWALAVNSLAEEAASTAGRWWACRWRPGAPRTGTSVRGMVDFGKNLVGFNVVNYLARNLDNVLVGRFAGAVALGLYSRAYALLTMPLSQLNSPAAAVAVPALSRLVDAPDRYRRAYCSMIEKIQMISVPGIAWLILCSDWVIVLFLGPRWRGAAIMYSLLGLAGILQPLGNSTGWLFISQGRTKEMLRWGLVGGSLTILSFVAGLPWGAVGVAAAYGLAGPLVLSPALFWYVTRRGPVSQADLYGTLKLPALAAAAVALSTLGLRQLGPWDPIIGLALSTPAGIAATLAVYGLHPRGRRSLVEAGQMLYEAVLDRSARPEQSSGASSAAVRT